MALKFVLRPGERFVVNGALFQNLERRSSLALHNRAWLIRDKDFLDSSEASTPIGRCYSAMLNVVMHQSGSEPAIAEVSAILMKFSHEIAASETRETFLMALGYWLGGDYYNALSTLRPLCAAPAQSL